MADINIWSSGKMTLLKALISLKLLNKWKIRYTFFKKSQYFWIVKVYIFFLNNSKKLRKNSRYNVTCFLMSQYLSKTRQALTTVKGTLMQIWKSTDMCLHIKIICWRFRLITAFTFWVMRTRDIWNVCLKTYRNYRIC